MLVTVNNTMQISKSKSQITMNHTKEKTLPRSNNRAQLRRIENGD